MESQINRIILQALESGDKYGLEIIKYIEEITFGRVKLKQPSLYSALRRMEKKGYISSFWQDSAIGGRRHYYSLSNMGKQELSAMDKNMSDQDIDDLIKEVNKNNSSDYTPPVSTLHLQDEEEVDNTLQNEPALKPIQLSQKDEEIKKAEFEKYEPTTSSAIKNSYSQQVRQYVEPTKIIQEQPSRSPTFAQQNSGFTPVPMYGNERDEPKIAPKEDDEVEFIREQPKSSWREDINYKDILGELDASNSQQSDVEYKSAIYPQQSTSVEEKISLNQQKRPHEKSELSKEIEQILMSDNKSKQTTSPSENDSKNFYSPSFNNSTVKTLEQISRRYNLEEKEDYSSDKVNYFATSPKVLEYKHINQDKLVVKKYSKASFSAITKEKNFLNINKFNLCRALIMSILFLAEIFVAYVLVKNNNLLYSPHSFMYWLAMGLVVVYIGAMLAITLQNFNKKIRFKEINWKLNLFYRILLVVVLFTLDISVCLCLGMGNFMDVEYFSLWLIPAIAIFDILLSWLIGIILNSFKIFRS